MNNTAHVIKRTGDYGRPRLIEYTPAYVGGWKVRSVTDFGESDWGKWSADSILADKLGSYGDGVRVLAGPDRDEALLAAEKAPEILAARKAA